MSTEQDYSAVEEVAFQHGETLVEADDLLREICQAGRRPTFAELTFFQREAGWNEKRVKTELIRMGNVLRAQPVAGSSADREASAKEAATSAAILEREGPKLAAKIEELQTKLNGLERDASLSQKRVEQQAAAVLQLRKLTPENVRESVRVEVNRIDSTLGRQVSDAEIRSIELASCLDASKYRDESYYLESLKRSFPNAIVEIVEGKMIRRKLSPEWPAIRESIQAELAELTTKLESLRAEHAAAIEQAELPFSYYAN